MSPERLSECLSIIRWTPDVLALALGCDVSLVNAWLDDLDKVPMKAGAWIETLATVHAAAERQKPVALKHKRHKG